MDAASEEKLRAYSHLEDLLARGWCVLFVKSIAEKDSIVPSPKAVYFYTGSAGPSRKATAETLASCIEELTDHPRKKICTREGCKAKGRPMPLSRFGADLDSKDGHMSACKDCESKRVNRYSRKAKGAK